MRSIFRGLGIGLAISLLTGTPTTFAGETLTAAESKALVTDRTVQMTRARDGATWKIYFEPDGKAYVSAGAAKGTWEVKDNGELCISWAKPACAKIKGLGNGLFARIEGDDSIAVTWTKIEQGKQLNPPSHLTGCN